MKFNLAKDQKTFRDYILLRIKEYPLYVNDGPGEDDDPIQLVTIGYYLDQGGYVALVFDTRRKADSDGEWTGHINSDTTMCPFPKWPAIAEALDDGKSIEIALPGGGSRRFDPEDESYEAILQLVGEMLRDTMIALRDEDAIKSLPLAKNAFLIIEEFDGRWAWPPSYETRKQFRLRGDKA